MVGLLTISLHASFLLPQVHFQNAGNSLLLVFTCLSDLHLLSYTILPSQPEALPIIGGGSICIMPAFFLLQNSHSGLGSAPMTFADFLPFFERPISVLVIVPGSEDRRLSLVSGRDTVVLDESQPKHRPFFFCITQAT